MNFPARYQFVTDLTKTEISFKTKIFYQNVPFEFSSPTSNKLFVEFWGSTTTKKNYFKVNSLFIKTYHWYSENQFLPFWLGVLLHYL